jgi:hypothetical protein
MNADSFSPGEERKSSLLIPELLETACIMLEFWIGMASK